MNAVKGIYHKGMVELFEKPGKMETSEVFVIFPDKQKKIARIGALFQDCKINWGLNLTAVEKAVTNYDAATGANSVKVFIKYN